jgi:hypothetical protein
LKPRFTFISFGVGWKRDAILRRLAKAKTRKRRKRTPFFATPDARFEVGEGTRVEGGLADVPCGACA